VTPRKVSHVAILGAGPAGRGLASALTRARLEVTLIDGDAAALAGAPCDEAAGLHCRSDLSAAAAADLVIGTAAGQELAGRARGAVPGAILALDLAGAALEEAGTDGALVGLQLLPPGKSPRILEIRRSGATTAEALVTLNALARRAGLPAVTTGPGGVARHLLAQRRRQLAALRRAGVLRQRIEALGAPPDPEAEPDAVTDRLVYPLINEGARLLQAGAAARASDIDLLAVHGCGFRMAWGGPMHLADRLGLAHVAGRLAALAGATGDDSLRPAPLLAELAEAGAGFADWSERKGGAAQKGDAGGGAT
jgi:3-hydroxyacyl-CoA dehydrogenase